MIRVGCSLSLTVFLALGACAVEDPDEIRSDPNQTEEATNMGTEHVRGCGTENPTLAEMDEVASRLANSF